MKKLTIKTTILIMAGLFLAGPGFAAITADQAARLGQDLTPMGGEKAGNASGTIPAWEGGITTPPAGYQKGMHHPDPFAADKGIPSTIMAHPKGLGWITQLFIRCGDAPGNLAMVSAFRE